MIALEFFHVLLMLLFATVLNLRPIRHSNAMSRCQMDAALAIYYLCVFIGLFVIISL